MAACNQKNLGIGKIGKDVFHSFSGLGGCERATPKAGGLKEKGGRGKPAYFPKEKKERV